MNLQTIFNTAQEAFEYHFYLINRVGLESAGTKAFYNVGFTIKNPMNNKINTLWRNWKLDYAKTEWDWYLSANPSVLEIEKVAKIWSRMYDPQDETKTVHSNYGFQWNRGNVVSQIDYVVNELKENPNSRRAVISIYDGK